MTDYIDTLSQRVVVFDGATGTWLQAQDLTDEDFGGPDLEGCNEILNITRPDVIESLHRAYLDVGSDVIETNTFGAFGVPLGEYDLADRAYELAAAGATIARHVADEFDDRFVAGSIGPGTKLPTLGQIAYADLRGQYEIESAGLIDGGVDLLIIETQFDLLSVKAAINGARRAMRSSGRDVPLQTQVTIELTGRMLPGTEIGAALAAIEALGTDVIGINCATGPVEMYEPIRVLSRHATVPISVIPNAGLPSVVNGEMHYDVGASDVAKHLTTFVEEYGVSVVGGCCGTTPEYIATLIDAVGHRAPAERNPSAIPAVTSTYSAVSLHQDTSFLIIGERTNANGSKAFREAMLDGDIDACVGIAENQVAEGGHLVDLCVDYVGRNGAADITPIAQRFSTDVAAPVVIDSTEPEVMQAALEQLGGRCVLNSANLESGDETGSRLDRVLTLAKEHGAAVICLLIDERGQARDVEWKMEVAHRLYGIATERYGLRAEDLIFDPLTFPLSTGDDDLRRDGMETIQAIKRIKSELPGVSTVLGVSNISFGLRPAARRVLNSVFLYECLEAGLDAAIIHAGKITPLSAIEEEHLKACTDLVYDRRAEGYDPLEVLLEAFETVTDAEKAKDPFEGLTLIERLEKRIVAGNAIGLEDDLDKALEETTALSIINDVLLAGMKTVGELFGAGEMQLPFVLRSAQTMKTSVRYLEPHLDHVDTADRGSIVIATVSGDVHDIGKNLVDIILTNNGYRVHNLGIKVSITEMIEALEKHEADAIGMSGLLVKSTLVMRDNLDELSRRGHDDVPVLLGGAALTRSYVEDDLARRHPGPVIYGKDAFAGLDAMEWIAGRRDEPKSPRRELPKIDRKETDHGVAPDRSPEVSADKPIPDPPFYGSRIVKGIELDEIAGYLNTTALLRNQWHYRPEHGETDAQFKERLAPELRRAITAARAEDLLQPQVVYGYFPVNGHGNELIVWADQTRTQELVRFRFPRQPGPPWLCIADYFRPVDADLTDVAAFHIVTMGTAVSQRTAQLFSEDRYEEYLKLHGLGVEMTEALAEYWHARVREELGIANEDDPTIRGLFRQRYRGGRYSWGYPACPDLEDNLTVADLLGADRVGIHVGPETGFQYQPEQTTSAIICHHPQAKYFIARKPRELRDAQ
ncbi:MAG: methionine synthase [Acidimicrobiia bacterium]|nr:MAG: methionine synthase [Acidimicrobiia bacterium]